MRSLNFFSPTCRVIFLVSMGITGMAFAQERNGMFKADTMTYQEETQEMHLSGNVTIQTDTLQISGPQLTINTSKNRITGTGNIVVSQADSAFNTDGISVDLDNETAELQHIHVEIKPPGNPHSLFIRADRYKDTPSMKFGESATLTSCELPAPHYMVWSQYFDYKPGQYILAYNNWLWMPIMGIPFGIWTPVYYYEVGKRAVIWNIPTIGRREVPGWGWFVQNTIDYDELDGKSSSVFVDWFENKGIGLGIKQQFQFDRVSGNVYYYNLTEQDTGRVTQKKAIDLGIIDGPHRVDTTIESVDGERLTASGRDAIDTRKIGYSYTNIGELGTLTYSDRSDYRQNTVGKRLAANYGLNGQNIYRFGYSEDQYNRYDTAISSVRGGTTWSLPEKTVVKSDAVFDRESIKSVNDDRLRWTSEIAKQWSPTVKATLTFDTLWDLDGDTVTRDIESGRNNFMYALPKLVINHSDTELLPLPITQELTIARYQEYAYISSQKAMRIYPDNGDFSLEPNTIIYRLNSFSTAANLPASSNLTTQIGFEQQLFKNPSLGWTEGDAGYALAFSQSLTSTLFNGIQSQFTYTNRFAPNTNNSPYVTLDVTRETRNDLSGAIIFYLNNPTQYYWKNASQYSWKAGKWDLYTTEIGIKPDSTLSATLQTGKKLNPTSAESLTQYLPLVLNVNAGTTQNVMVRYDLSADTNQWINNGNFTVLQSSLSTAVVIDEKSDYSWEIRTTFRYNTTDSTSAFNLSRYELQTISILKKEHCQTYQFGYNTLADEYTFQVSILAFPDDKITFKKTRDQIRLQGILDDGTQERL